MICANCQKRTANCARNLCAQCYYVPEIRKQYPVAEKKYINNTGVEPDFCGSAPLPQRPTDAPPGSEAKVKVLCERASMRQSLWHPDDMVNWDKWLDTFVSHNINEDEDEDDED